MSTEGREQDLIDWAAGELPPDRQAELDAHLRECGECRGLALDLQSVSAGLRCLDDRAAGVLIGPSTPAADAPTRHRRRVKQWGWAIAAAVLLAVGLPLLVDAPPDPETAAPGGAVAGHAARQLVDVEEALRAGRSDVLVRYARNSASVPVRLTALAGSRQVSSLTSDALVAAFVSETDPLVRLWLVVEIARAGDPGAARRVRRMIDDQGAEAAPELRSAGDMYLQDTGREETP